MCRCLRGISRSATSHSSIVAFHGSRTGGTRSTSLRGEGTAELNASRTVRRWVSNRRANLRTETSGSTRRALRICPNKTTLDLRVINPRVHGRKANPTDPTRINQVGPNQTSTTRSSGARTGEHTHRYGLLRTGVPDGSAYARALEFSPDGRLLMTVVGSRAQLWDLEIGKLQYQFDVTTQDEDEELRPMFSPDGESVVMVARDGRILLLRVANSDGAKVLTWLPAPPQARAFSDDGKTLAVADSEQATTLWDIASSRQVGYSTEPSAREIRQMGFIDGNTTLVSLHKCTRKCSREDMTVQRVGASAFQAQACRLAGRNFTRAEWQQWIPDEPYHRTCARWAAGT